MAKEKNPTSAIDKIVEIKCQGATTIDLEDLNEFQGNLKELSHKNYNKLKKEILTHGFSEPVSVWIDDGVTHLLNGHQRVRVLMGLRDEGYYIPKVPASIVEASDMREAKEKVLALTSQYGEITDYGLYEFMDRAKLDYSILENYRFPELDLEKFKEGFELEKTDENIEETDEKCPECGQKVN